MTNSNNLLNARCPFALAGNWDDMWFDDSRQRCILIKDGSLYLWAPWLAHVALYSDPVLFFSLPKVSLQPAPRIISAQLSLDSKILAIQKLEYQVEVYDLNPTSYKPSWKFNIRNNHGNKNAILRNGLMWSDHGGNSQDLIVVTKRGLELHKVSVLRGQCKLSRQVNQNTSRFWYEPNHRFYLLAGFPSSRHGTFELTGYFLNFEESDRPKFELQPPVKSPTFETTAGVRFEDIYLATIYGTLYCVIHAPDTSSSSANAGDVVRLYAITKNCVKLSHLCRTKLRSRVRFSIVDNLLICHCYEVKLTVMFDVKMSCTKDSAGSAAEYLDPICRALPMFVSEDSNMSSKKMSPHRTLLSSVEVDMEGEEWGDAVGVESENRPEDKMSAVNKLERQRQILLSTPPSQKRHQSSNSQGPLNANDEASISVPLPLKFDASLPVLNVDDAAANVSIESINSDMTSINLDSNSSKCPQFYNVEHVEYIYPNWLWDRVNRRHWKLSYEVSDVAHFIFDPRKLFYFLAHRGCLMGGPRPIPISNVNEHEEIAEKTKMLMLNKILVYISDSIGLPWLEVVFDITLSSYVNESDRIVQDIEINKNKLLIQTDSPDTGSANSSPVPNSMSARLQRWAGVKAVSTPPGHSTSSSATVLTRRTSHHGEVDLFEESDHFHAPQVSHDRTTLSGVLRPTIAPEISRQLEPQIALQMFLPAIAFVGDYCKQCENSQTLKSYSANHHVSVPHIEIQLSRHRDSEGALFLSQTEMLSHVWLKAIYGRSINTTISVNVAKDKHICLTYLSWALITYVSALRSRALPVQTTISLLLINLLAALGKYADLTHLLQFLFFQDSAEVAMTILDMSYTLADQKLDKLVAPDAILMSGLWHASEVRSSTSMMALTMDNVLQTFQQSAIDMLWRLNEKVAIVRWLLGRGQVRDAMDACMNKGRGIGSRRADGLSPGASIMGNEFFQSAVVALELLVSKAQQQPYIITPSSDTCIVSDGEGDRVELLYSVYSFIREWDRSSLVVSSTTGMSRIASRSQDFPDFAFSLENTTSFKKIFGFPLS